MFDEVLYHLFTQLSIHSVLSVLDFYVSHLHLNTLGGPWRRYKVGANKANALAPGRSGNGTTHAVHIYAYQEITASKWLSPAVSMHLRNPLLAPNWGVYPQVTQDHYSCHVRGFIT